MDPEPIATEIGVLETVRARGDGLGSRDPSGAREVEVPLIEG
jgi:hypothetical protein